MDRLRRGCTGSTRLKRGTNMLVVVGGTMLGFRCGSGDAQITLMVNGIRSSNPIFPRTIFFVLSITHSFPQNHTSPSHTGLWDSVRQLSWKDKEQPSQVLNFKPSSPPTVRQHFTQKSFKMGVTRLEPSEEKRCRSKCSLPWSSGPCELHRDALPHGPHFHLLLTVTPQYRHHGRFRAVRYG